MRQRAIGVQGLSGPVLGLGCMGLSVYYGQDTANASPGDVINAALDAGVTLLDTSDSYGAGSNERVVGRSIRTRRDSVLLSTKFGRAHHDRAVNDSAAGSPRYVGEACEASLRRLGVDHIDIYIYHRVDPDVPVEDTVTAMAELVTDGKVRYLGLSEVTGATLSRACRVHPITVVQSEYSLLTRDVERAVGGELAENGATLAAYSPLARGLLSGAVRSAADLAPDDWRRGSPRFQGDNLSSNVRLVERLDPIATSLGLTRSQLALAWVISRDAIPIQGATSRAQIEENAAAAEVVLPVAVREHLDQLFPRQVAAGARAPDSYLKHVQT